MFESPIDPEILKQIFGLLLLFTICIIGILHLKGGLKLIPFLIGVIAASALAKLPLELFMPVWMVIAILIVAVIAFLFFLGYVACKLAQKLVRADG